MKSIFFYGTLRHVPLLECVMGRAASALDIAPDALPGHRIAAAVDGPYPVLVVDPDGDATGVVVRGLTDEDIARLNYYEAGFAYDLQRLTLRSGETADVYVPLHDIASDGPWDLADWQQDWAEMSVAAAQEVMGSFGHVSAKEITRRFPRIRARAWARVLAQSGHHSPHTFRGKIEVLERRRAYTDFFALDEIEMRHETFDGAMSPVLTRAVFLGSDAALVLPYDPVRDRVLLVEQIRLGPMGRHDPACWQLEPIAGMVDPGEQPELAARREAMEEAGLSLEQMETVGAGYASPGSATDFFHSFVGLCDLPDTTAGIGGAVEEGENIRSHLMSFATALGMAEAGQIGNVPLTMLIYWLAHHRDRLRAASL